MRTAGLRLEDVVEAALPHWNPDNEYDFGGRLMRTVHNLHFHGVQTVAQCQQAARRRGPAATKPPRKRQRGPPRKGDRESLRLKGQPPLSLAGEPEEAKVESKEDDDVEIEDAPDAVEVVAEATKAVVPRAKNAESRGLRPNEVMRLPDDDSRRVALVAKKKAESVVYEAALNDFVRRHDLWDKERGGVKTYQEIFFAIEDRVERGKGPGADKGTAAKWLCLLMRHKGDPERLTPRDVRHKMRG